MDPRLTVGRGRLGESGPQPWTGIRWKQDFGDFYLRLVKANHIVYDRQNSQLITRRVKLSKRCQKGGKLF